MRLDRQDPELTSVNTIVDGSRSLRDQLDDCAREIVESTIIASGTVTLAAERLGVHRAPFYRLVRRLGVRLARYQKNQPRRIEREGAAA